MLSATPPKFADRHAGDFAEHVFHAAEVAFADDVLFHHIGGEARLFGQKALALDKDAGQRGVLDRHGIGSGGLRGGFRGLLAMGGAGESQACRQGEPCTGHGYWHDVLLYVGYWFLIWH